MVCVERKFAFPGETTHPISPCPILFFLLRVRILQLLTFASALTFLAESIDRKYILWASTASVLVGGFVFLFATHRYFAFQNIIDNVAVQSVIPSLRHEFAGMITSIILVATLIILAYDNVQLKRDEVVALALAIALS